MVMVYIKICGRKIKIEYKFHRNQIDKTPIVEKCLKQISINKRGVKIKKLRD